MIRTYKGKNIVKITNDTGELYKIKTLTDGVISEEIGFIPEFEKYGIHSLTPRKNEIIVSLLADKNKMIKFNRCTNMPDIIDVLRNVIGNKIRLHNEFIQFDYLVNNAACEIKNPMDVLLAFRFTELHGRVLQITSGKLGSRIRSKIDGKIVHLFLKVGVLKYDPHHLFKHNHPPTRHKIFRIEK